MTGPSAGSGILSKGHRWKVCMSCGKDSRRRAGGWCEDETNLHIDEEGFFFCGKHRRDQVCHACFQNLIIFDQIAQAITDIDIHDMDREFKRGMDRAVKGMSSKDMSLKEGDEVPWSEDDGEDDGVPSENVQRQIQKTSSSSVSGERICAHCGKVGNFDRCAKCKVTFYCSRSHQAADYAKHKANCQAPKTLVNDRAQPTETRQDEEPLNAPNNSEQPPSSSSKMCAHCGKTDKLSMCTRCKSTWYCSKDHQAVDYRNHKAYCVWIAEKAKTAAQPAITPILKVISWRELERMHPYLATGRTLEVFIVSEPSVFPSKCDGMDAEGWERRIALHTDHPPKGLRKGCVLRWRNPSFHYFLDGSSGANIEHWDLPNITVSDLRNITV